jgi:inorganic pyrophosphatase
MSALPANNGGSDAPSGMGEQSVSMALLREPTDGWSTPDGKTRGPISEWDLVRYDRGSNNYEEQLSRNIMRRCFESLDVEGRGHISRERLVDLAKYLRMPHGDSPAEQTSADKDRNILLKFPNGCTFEDFFSWWKSLDDWEGGQKFALVSAKFAEPFHVQQLMTREEGEKFTLNWRCHFLLKDTETGAVVPASPWHDIPLYVRSLVKTTPEEDVFPLVNFVCEIPRFTRSKFEISRTEPYNPIKQDTKKGVPRFYTHGDMMFNYGALPRTYESPLGFEIDGVHYKGDNDPIDLIEIGVRQLPTGSVTPVKVLGVLGMVDDGEMDFKIVGISESDPLARSMEDIDDVRKMMPGALEALHEWLRVYKIVDGKPENKFVWNGAYKGRAFTHELIKEAHRMWANLAVIKGTRETDQ